LLLFFFIPAVWQGKTEHSSFFYNPVGWLWEIFKILLTLNRLLK